MRSVLLLSVTVTAVSSFDSLLVFGETGTLTCSEALYFGDEVGHST